MTFRYNCNSCKKGKYKINGVKGIDIFYTSINL